MKHGASIQARARFIAPKSVKVNEFKVSDDQMKDIKASLFQMPKKDQV